MFNYKYEIAFGLGFFTLVWLERDAILYWLRCPEKPKTESGESSVNKMKNITNE